MYRTVKELTLEERNELRNNLWMDIVADNLVGQMYPNATCADEITDAELDKRFEGIQFVEDDFWCNEKD